MASSNSDRYANNAKDDGDGPGGYQPTMSFHEKMLLQARNGGQASNRSKSPDNKGSGWGDNPSRDRSRSPERFDKAPPARSFHEQMMAQARSN